MLAVLGMLVVAILGLLVGAAVTLVLEFPRDPPKTKRW